VRSPQSTLDQARNSLPRINTNTGPNAASPNKPKPGVTPAAQNAASPRKGAAPPAPAQAGPKPEENKDSPEYKKNLAKQAGPCLYMDYDNATNYGMAESLFSSLKDIFEAVAAHRSRYGVVFPHKFMEILRREFDVFRTPMHQDAHEFLNLLLNQVIDNVDAYSKGQPEGSPRVNTSWIHELFEGTMTSETRCLTCENVSQRDEPFLDISVDLEHHSSVTACIRKYSEEEMLCERNKFHCDNCGGLQEAERRQKIKRLPKVLALHLKRFKYTEDLQRLFKLFHRVVFPWHLRLFNTTDDAEDPDRLYELYAVVVHIGGGPYHGHYVSIIKTSDRGWLLFDDELVEPVDRNYIQNFFGTGDDKTGLACAYVLFYQETTLEAVQREQEAEGRKAEGEMATANDIVLVDAAETNGVVAKADGETQDPFSPVTPIAEDEDKFVSLDHATTAPDTLKPAQKPLEHATTTPVFSMLGRKKSESQLNHKKEKAKEEKERKEAEKARKAAEKEQEKERKAKLKEAQEARLRESKKYSEDLKAAVAASKAIVKDELDQRAAASGEPTVVQPTPPPPPKEGGVNRFMPGSMSLRGKSKFWSHSKEKSAEHEQAKDGLISHDSPATSESGFGSTATLPVPDKTEKIKNRFSLGRKKSQAGL